MTNSANLLLRQNQSVTSDDIIGWPWMAVRHSIASFMTCHTEPTGNHADLNADRPTLSSIDGTNVETVVSSSVRLCSYWHLEPATVSSLYNLLYNNSTPKRNNGVWGIAA